MVAGELDVALLGHSAPRQELGAKISGKLEDTGPGGASWHQLRPIL